MTEQNERPALIGVDVEKLMKRLEETSAVGSPTQQSGRLTVSAPEPDHLPPLPTVTLHCLDAESAQQVIDACDAAPRKGRNSARLDGDKVIIAYANKMWPYDIAEMAHELGLASDSEAAKVFACL